MGGELGLLSMAADGGQPLSNWPRFRLVDGLLPEKLPSDAGRLMLVPYRCEFHSGIFCQAACGLKR
jgi:hypothetical protein